MWVRFGGKVGECDGSKDCGGLAMVSEVALYVYCYADLYIRYIRNRIHPRSYANGASSSV